MANTTDRIAPEISQDFFASAYRAGFRTTLRFLQSKGVNVQEAEDVAQSAWTQGWEARAQLLNPAAIVPWVNTIAYHQLCSMHRRPEKHVPLTGLEDAAGVGPAAKADARTLLSHCSPRDRVLLILRYFEGMDIREIAALQGLSEIAVRVRIHRCQVGLRNKINRFVLRLWPAEPETQGA